MKSNIQRVFRKRMMMGLLAILFIAGSVCFINVNGSHALANNTVTPITLAKGIDYKLEKHSDIREYRKNGVLTAPELSDASIADKWIFAGWYQDEACKKVLSSNTVSGEAYAKFVPVDVLSVKCQISADTTPESTGTLIRCISSVDSLKYKQIGFEFITPNGTQYMQSKKVGTRINAINEGNDCGYSPKVVDTESEYFFSAVYRMSKKETDAENGIDKEDFDTTYIVKPYWVTSDGTTVYGMSRCISVNEALKKDVIHIPVKMAEAPANDHTLTANSQTLTYVDYDADSQYAHFALSINSSLDSATKYEIAGSDGNGNSVSTSYIYRNLGTKYNGTNADDSWYEIYNTDDTSEDEYVIVTSADLYGMAGIVNNGNTLKDNTVYVACDIEANKGYADHEALKWDKTKGADGQLLENDEQGTDYYWTRIGNDTNRFGGVFDGQMHTISGIYYDSSEATDNFHGMFGVTTTSAQIKKFSLKNSYFNLIEQWNSIGSIVGRTYGGQFSSVYSNAVVIGANYNIGGLIGQYYKNCSNLKLSNCWFDGSVVNNTSKYERTGGLAGGLLSDAVITNCLNTGTISMLSRETTPCIGGLVGWIANEKVQFYNCFNTGKVTYNTKATDGFGTIVGKIDNAEHASFTDIFYLKNETCSVPVNNTTNNSVTGVDRTEVSGVKALTTDISVLFSYITDETTKANESYWAIVSGGTPVLSSFKEFAQVDGNKADAMAIDTSWYNNKDTEFVLSDAADLYGLALLSQETDQFTDETIKLNKDIVIPNTGNSEEWSQTVPEFEWIGVGTADFPFAGMFDGQMHTIRGIYMNTSNRNTGLFNAITSTTTLCNFSLNNTYIYCTANNMGSVVGYAGGGALRTIYSDANITSTGKNTGGMVGQIDTSPLTMYDCWFDGTVTQSSSNSHTGGLVGILYGGGADITNCLNSGDVSSMTSTEPFVGGLVGGTSINALNITNSLNTGNVYKSNEATQNYGLVIGRWGNYATYAKQISNTYTVSQEGLSYIYTKNGATEVETATFAETSILGTDALKKMPLLFTNIVSASEYASCWAVVVDGVPVLESFADVTEKEYLAIDASWYNGSGNYTLKDVSDLYGFTMLSARIDFAEETISLSKNIDSIVINEGEPYGEDGKAGGGDDWEPKYEWISIGSTTKPFAGTFNGNMKSIKGLYMNTDSYSGLFSVAGKGAVIQNLSLKNSYITTNGVNNGSIVGRAYGGTIDTVYSDAIVIGNNLNIGGLVGQVPSAATEKVTLNNCWFDGIVTNNVSDQQNTGGLIGNVLNDVLVTNCLNTGAVSMPNYTKNEGKEGKTLVRPCVGGFAGHIAATVTEGDETRDTNVLFSHCFNAGVVTYNKSTTTGYGAFAGYTQKKSVCFKNSYMTKDNGPTSYSKDGDGAILLDCQKLNQSDYYGTKAFDQAKALFEPIEDENYRIYWGIVKNGTPVLSSFAEYAGDGAIAINTNWYDANKDSYTLNSAGDLYGFALISDKEAIAGYAGKTITLGQDITINKGTAADWAMAAPQFEWVSVCTNGSYRFQGTFEGNGKTISGLYLDETKAYRGFFGYTDNGSVVRNFRIVNSFFNSTAQAIGSVAGNARGSFDSIYSDAIVIGGFSNVGGMLGQISGDGVEITNCWFDGTVTNISAEKQSTGGLIGAANLSVTMKNCLNTGAVSAPNYVKYDEGTTDVKPLIGGLIGFAQSGYKDGEKVQKIIVQHCLNIGEVSFNNKATAGFGSIIGRIGNLGKDYNLGTIVVNNTYATSQSCWETISTDLKDLPLNVEVVDANVLNGENATEVLAGLFDDSLTTSWAVVENGAVLKDFAEYTIEGRSVSALHQWLTSSDELEATLANPITLPNPRQDNSTFFRQGGYADKDGRYFYQAYITYKDTEETINPKETDNLVRVLKYDMATSDYIWSGDMELNHANDITYNSKLDCLIVCHSGPNKTKLSYIDVTQDGLVLQKTFDIKYNIDYIDYNALRDVYIAGTSEKFFVLNSNFQKISEDFSPPDMKINHSGQGVSCDDDYIYFVLTAKAIKTEVVAVYDWSGTLVTTITLDIDTQSDIVESENISVVGDKIYIMTSEIVGSTSNQKEKPANVYVIDKSVTE